MATIVSSSTTQHFANNPIVVEVIPGNVNEKATFHQIKLSVVVSFDNKGKMFTFSAPASSTENASFDISSAIRSLTSQYQHETISGLTTRYYPYASYILAAWDEYLLDGTVRKSVPSLEMQGTAFMED